MSRKSVICRLTLAAALFWAVPAWASDIGHEVADQVSLASYQHYLDDLLYTHIGDNRNALSGPDKGLARENIVDTFESFGLDVEVEPFVYQGTTCYNVIATQVGMVYPDAYYVIGAHYDSVGNPGADDNASGVAGVLEIARILSAYESEYTIKYMAFDAEEYGLIGSDFYVDNHYYDDIRGMISMDMIAYDIGTNLAEVSGFASCATIKDALTNAVVEYGQGLAAGMVTETYSRSDHGPFQEAGFQACLLIEDALDDNPCYHTSCDSVDTEDYIDYGFAVNMTRSVAGYLVDNAHVAPPIDCQTGEGCDITPDHDEDCNANGVWDHCDIRCGTSQDVNLNSVPDECEPHETWYVNAANCPGPGSGSEADPFCTIQMAIDAAASGMTSVVEIIVADGTYTGTGNKNLEFGGKLITLRSANGAARCIIDCQGSGRGFYFHSGETSEAKVDGFTIRNGSVTSSSPGGAYGDGVYCVAGSRPTLSNCMIRGNATAASGSAVYCSSADPTLTNCSIIANGGSGVYCSYSHPTLSHCSISNNTGRGVSCYSSSPTVSNCTISGNARGGVWCYSSSNPKLKDCSISSNATSDSDGAGVYCSFSDPKFGNCTITGNTASGNGGGVYCVASYPTLLSCSISQNRASSGGGVYCSNYSHATLTNCTLMGNEASDVSGQGGAVLCFDSSPKLTNCTIAGNAAAGSAASCGGVYCSNSSPKVTNCILWTNTPQEVCVASGSPVVTFSDIQSGWPGTGNINTDPCFALDGDPRLMPTSPCIDAGTNAPSGGLLAQDADGSPRPHDGDGDGQAVTDIGAYEFDASGPTIALVPSTLGAFGYAGNPDPEPQTLSLRNRGTGVLSWQVMEDCPWLSVDPVSGSSQDEIDLVTISFDSTGLAPGEYPCDLTISAAGATNSPRIVRVTLELRTIRRVPAAYATIQAAIDAAADRDRVIVSDGVWTGAGNKNLDFGGRAIKVSSLSGPANCIINCENTGRGFYFHNAETPEAVVEGFTIRNGNVTSWSPGGARGGGVYCSLSRPTLTNCVINACKATGTASLGGGLYCSSSAPTLANCVIAGCSATGTWSCGGGIYSSSANPTLVNCTVTTNAAADRGGGLYCVDSNPALTNCTLTANMANGSGGGVYCSSSSPTLTNCILWADTPQEIYVYSGTPTVSYSDIQGGWTGMGNLNTNPFFVDAANGDFHLASNSPCIDAGDPASDYSLEPEPDGGRINMGAYGNTPEAESKGWLYIQGYNLVEKTRVGRTLFDYRLSVRVKNESETDATAVSLELLHMPSNVTIIEPLVDVGSVPAGATATSVDTFTIRVDRRTLISELGISWRLTYTLSGATEDRTFAGSASRETLEPSYVPIEDVPLPVRDSAAGPPAPASVATTPN